jgi:hypothetical protein
MAQATFHNAFQHNQSESVILPSRRSHWQIATQYLKKEIGSFGTLKKDKKFCEIMPEINFA